MRLALISDLHGNILALQTVLDYLESQNIDQLICLGDVATLGPAPGQVLQKLKELNCLCIMGNHDDFMLDPKLIHSYTEAPIIVEAVDWCRSQLSSDEIEFIRGFKSQAQMIELGTNQSLLVYHGSPQSHMQDILANSPGSELDPWVEGYDADIFAGGHTHFQMLRSHRGRCFINPGSVGMAFNEFIGAVPSLSLRAEFAIIQAENKQISAQFHRLELDKAQLLESLEGSSNPLVGYLREQYTQMGEN